MNKLSIREVIKDYVYDSSDFLLIYNNHLQIFKYKKIEKLSNTEIIISFSNYKVIVEGKDLKMKKMNKEELLVDGLIKGIEFLYE